MQRHLNSLLTLIVNALKQLIKGAKIMAHSAVLLGNQVAELQAANEAATRRKAHKRKRIQKEGVLTIEEGARLAALKEFGARGDGKKDKKKARVDGGSQMLQSNPDKGGSLIPGDHT
jgi:hypothetical protein